eukprot:scaffold92759_cov54-Phaeocystis_antarctica.AAC.2
MDRETRGLNHGRPVWVVSRITRLPYSHAIYLPFYLSTYLSVYIAGGLGPARARGATVGPVLGQRERRVGAAWRCWRAVTPRTLPYTHGWV